MALHGVKRTNLTGESLEAQLKKDEKKIQQFRDLSEKAFGLRAKISKCSSEELEWKDLVDGLSLCTEILRINSEFYTIWNLRKKLLTLLLDQPNKEVTEKKELLRRELLFSEEAIKYNYKSYWAWYHRKWLIVLEMKNHYEVDFERELYLCSKLLSLDGRNFHCWTYRRWVASELPEKQRVEGEFKYTTLVLETKDSFSNYSAFHQRTLLIPQLPPHIPLKTTISNEIELLHNAWFTQPNDSSPWFYFLWLMHKSELDRDEERIEQEVNICLDLLSLEPDCKWPMLMIVFLYLKKEQHSGKDSGRRQKLQDSLLQLQKVDHKHKTYYSHLLQTNLLS